LAGYKFAFGGRQKKCHCRTTPALVFNVCVNQYHYPIQLACDLGSMKANLQRMIRKIFLIVTSNLQNIKKILK